MPLSPTFSKFLLIFIYSSFSINHYILVVLNEKVNRKNAKFKKISKGKPQITQIFLFFLRVIRGLFSSLLGDNS
jgi:hypothetical protein